MSKPLQDTYRVPVVLNDGRGPFTLTQNPPDSPLRDPERAGTDFLWTQELEASEYAWSTLVKARTPVNDKNVPVARMRELVELAERTFARSPGMFQDTALISGMPVVLRTNSPHLMNFWSRNWYLGAIVEVNARFGAPPIIMRAAINVQCADGSPAPIGAYFCPETREIVFINTDYYGQCKSWALGAAGVGLADFGIHSIHGACVEIDGIGVLIIAPTGTGKSTYTNELAKLGFINSDDWVYVKEENDQFFAFPSERYIYVRSNSVQDDPEQGHDLSVVQTDPVMRQQYEIFQSSPAENVPVVDGRRVYARVPNSRVLINPARLAPVSFKTPIKIVLLLRRDDVSPYIQELNSDEAVAVLEKGEYMISPGVTDDKSKWGTLAYESWYNPYLLAPNPVFEIERFRAVAEKGGAQYVIINTSGKYASKHLADGKPDTRHLIHATAQEILKYVSRYSGKTY